MFKNKLKNKIFPNGFIQVTDIGSITFYYIQDDLDDKKIPKLLSLIVVKSDLEVKIFVHFAPLSHDVFQHVISEKNIKQNV